MRVVPVLLVLGLIVLAGCVEPPQERAKQALSCKCGEGVVKVSETGTDVTYKCDDALCPGMVGFECWQRTCNYVSVSKATGDLKRFDAKCCEEPSDGGVPGPSPPGGGQCVSDSDCVPATCCHPTECTSKGSAPDCSGQYCTMECAPGTLDCGQGRCACDGGKCKADIVGQ